ncbi:hypothetical protein HW130_14235 [Streptomyces sp. PKU-EA00015]|uniref:hypothetical protein n=1 Tax=Streptomyces sp. PKU-EA00015 TaxID=2748326 RepID=UPI0015A36FA3|nr:hypothetical protein [Streptomyces sp. PKU-EA00015]NWF27413.1 hypothetical protein [Streptomyces sp. PKU-EA00015]
MADLTRLAVRLPERDQRLIAVLPAIGCRYHCTRSIPGAVAAGTRGKLTADELQQLADLGLDWAVA